MLNYLTAIIHNFLSYLKCIVHSQSAYEKLPFCSSGFAVYSSEERQLVLELVMGFSTVFKWQRTMHMLTPREATGISPWKSQEKGHHYRCAACSLAALTLKPLSSGHQAPRKVAQHRVDLRLGCKQEEYTFTKEDTQSHRRDPALSHKASQRPAYG